VSPTNQAQFHPLPGCNPNMPLPKPDYILQCSKSGKCAGLGAGPWVSSVSRPGSHTCIGHPRLHVPLIGSSSSVLGAQCPLPTARWAAPELSGSAEAALSRAGHPGTPLPVPGGPAGSSRPVRGRKWGGPPDLTTALRAGPEAEGRRPLGPLRAPSVSQPCRGPRPHSPASVRSSAMAQRLHLPPPAATCRHLPPPSVTFRLPPPGASGGGVSPRRSHLA
jgi:hypothetical protein